MRNNLVLADVLSAENVLGEGGVQMEQNEAILCGVVCAAVGLVSLLAGIFQWGWWMKTIGFLPTKQYGAGMARWHFIIFGVMIIGLGCFFTYDALTAARFQPLPDHLQQQLDNAENGKE